MLYIKGTLFLVIVIIIFRYSYLQFKSNQVSKSLLSIILGGTLLRLWGLSDTFLHAWDERYHALVAKNFISNPLVPVLYKTPLLPYDYHQWVINHVWLHKQPLSLWLMSMSIYLFGNVEWAVRLPSLFLSITSIYLTYQIAKFFTNEKTAILTAFFQSVNGLIIEISVGRQSTDHIDNTFLFFIELSIWLVVFYIEKKKNIILLGIGMATGLAILTKSFPALIVLPIFFILTFKQDRWARTMIHLGLILISALIVYLPWQIYIYNAFPKEAAWENHYNFLHLTQVIEGHSGSIFWQLKYALKIWNELIYVVFIWFIFYASKRLMDNKTLSLIIWIAIPYLFFSCVPTKMIAYPIFTAPAIFMIEAMFCWQLIEKQSKPSWINKLLVTLIIFLAVRYGYERVKPFDAQKEDKMVVTKIKNWASIFNQNEKNVIFNTEYYIELMFYFDNCVAYPYIPENKDIKYLNQLGYTVFIVNDVKIDSTKFNDYGVLLLK